jgi:C_GCAxxG_C_C family probable redox protein
MPPSDFPKVSPNHALRAFNSGFNCAQSVVKVFAEALGFDEKEAVSKAAGLGGGGFHGICGAVSGAYLVLEMFCSRGNGSKDQKLCVETLIDDFRQQFQQIHGTDQCKILLRNEANQPKNTAHSICERCIVDAVEIVNGLLGKSF